MGVETMELRPVMRALMYILAGYLSGSVLYARLFARLFKAGDLTEVSRDHNPGTANAFRFGGFWCGTLTLLCDLLKGFLPVFLYVALARQEVADGLALALVIASPVIGHVLPVFHHFQGGKGIAASFGCLLGLIPHWQPAALLTALFIFFSVVLRITPHFQRTLVTYLCAPIGMLFVTKQLAVAAGFLLISFFIVLKLLSSKEEREPMGVQILWMR